jgi:hypothetical protein
LRANDTVDGQPGALLKILHGSFGRRTEDAVDNEPEVGSATQRPLEPANGVAGRSLRDRRLTRIWHMNTP